MKSIRIIIALVSLCFMLPSFSLAQQMDKGIDISLVTGLNIGATTPVPIPKEVKLTSYNPKFNPKLGINTVYYFNKSWGVGTGLSLDWKGMRIHTKVTDVHLSVNVPDHGTVTGNVTGKGTTSVKTLYLTQPIYGIYRFNPKWQVKAGIYLSEALSRKFDGDVSNVKIVEDQPGTRELNVSYATLDYSKDVRKFDAGILLGGEFKLNNRFGFYGDFTWGLTPFFSKTVPMHFTMRDIYLSLGATYKIW